MSVGFSLNSLAVFGAGRDARAERTIEVFPAPRSFRDLTEVSARSAIRRLGKCGDLLGTATSPPPTIKTLTPKSTVASFSCSRGPFFYRMPPPSAARRFMQPSEL
jgi:hypothetical protein